MELASALKKIARVVIIAGTTETVDRYFSRMMFSADGIVDKTLSKVGSVSLGFMAGNKAADYMLDTAEKLYSAYKGEENGEG